MKTISPIELRYGNVYDLYLQGRTRKAVYIGKEINGKYPLRFIFRENSNPKLCGINLEELTTLKERLISGRSKIISLTNLQKGAVEELLSKRKL